MGELRQLRRYYIFLLYPISILLIVIARLSLYFAEYVYARGIYKWLSQGLSLITGVFPISLAEFIIILLPAGFILGIVLLIRQLILERGRRKIVLLKSFINIGCAGGIIIFLFVMLAGINYYRFTFAEYSNLEIQDSTLDELYSLTTALTQRANELREKTTGRDENGVFQLTVSKHQLAKIANKAMKNLGKEYEVLDGYYGKAKPILLSKYMSYTDTTGIFIPFTMEANVNVDISDYSIPVTMLHELAHLRGFMREDEANYIAYLAGSQSDNAELQYSSTMLALIIAGNTLYEESPRLYDTIRELYSEGVKLDLRANSAYWAKFDNRVISAISNKMNDAYLKVNDQSDGVQSYGRMLDLLLAKFRRDETLD